MRLLLIGEVAKELGVSRPRIDTLTREGKIKCLRIGRLGQGQLRLYESTEVRRVKRERAKRLNK